MTENLRGIIEKCIRQRAYKHLQQILESEDARQILAAILRERSSGISLIRHPTIGQLIDQETKEHVVGRYFSKMVDDYDPKLVLADPVLRPLLTDEDRLRAFAQQVPYSNGYEERFNEYLTQDDKVRVAEIALQVHILRRDMVTRGIARILRRPFVRKYAPKEKVREAYFYALGHADTEAFQFLSEIDIDIGNDEEQPGHETYLNGSEYERELTNKSKD